MEQSLRQSKTVPHPPILGADGGVIMPKLGNATAKSALSAMNRTILSYTQGCSWPSNLEVTVRNKLGIDLYMT
jgi:hypothetical protein